MVGHMVARILSRAKGLEVDGTERSTPAVPLYFDAASGAEGLRAIWRRPGGYRFVINCIGVTRAALDERDPRAVETAVRVNAILPHQLAAVAAEFGSRIIHVSTDGVFSPLAGASSTTKSRCEPSMPQNAMIVVARPDAPYPMIRWLRRLSRPSSSIRSERVFATRSA